MKKSKCKLLVPIMLGLSMVLGMGVSSGQNATVTGNSTSTSTSSVKSDVPYTWPNIDVEVILEAVVLTRPNGQKVTLTPGKEFAFVLYEFERTATTHDDPAIYGPLYRLPSSGGAYPVDKSAIKNKKLYYDKNRTKTHQLMISPATKFATGQSDYKEVFFPYAMEEYKFNCCHVLTKIDNVILYGVQWGRDIPMVKARLEINFIQGQGTPGLHLQIKIIPEQWLGP